jgi:hypothetical protein
MAIRIIAEELEMDRVGDHQFVGGIASKQHISSESVPGTMYKNRPI